MYSAIYQNSPIGSSLEYVNTHFVVMMAILVVVTTNNSQQLTLV